MFEALTANLDVGLCGADVFLHWNSAAEEGAWVGLKPDLDPLEIKSGPPWRVQFWFLFDPFIVANLFIRHFKLKLI